ncbi:DUF1697 domain-containing protein [Bosea sp. (in: a-proteobacteria)]|uniref:DUF1697 domain-containing protein n=1 Tax=Bosea sp. (in: a-proteobacteria) TaxID=1871050 RepID=UPI002FC5C78E
MAVLIALLRAVNVGGASSLKMEALRALCPALGFRHARTLVQSGNLVCAHDGSDTDAAARQLEEAVAGITDYRPRVIGRSLPEWQRIIADNPLPVGTERAPAKVLVMALAEEPGAGALERLLARHDGPEEIALIGRNLYLHYPDGIGRSKLTNALIERQLGVPGTARNWNTVEKLAQIAREIETLD